MIASGTKKLAPAAEQMELRVRVTLNFLDPHCKTENLSVQGKREKKRCLEKSSTRGKSNNCRGSIRRRSVDSRRSVEINVRGLKGVRAKEKSKKEVHRPRNEASYVGVKEEGRTRREGEEGLSKKAIQR